MALRAAPDAATIRAEGFTALTQCLGLGAGRFEDQRWRLAH
jgi:hypothetical protein